jgi:hypothetical protein
MQSSRSRLVLVALFGALALGAFTAAAAQAQAVEAPRWSIEGTALTAGKTHFITAKAYTTSGLSLTAGKILIKCKTLNLKAGSLLGSEPGNAGKNDEAIEFTECTVSGTTGGKIITKCVVESNTPGVILTNPIKSELVETENAEPKAEKGSLLILFEPLVGTSFAALKFKTETGGVCPPETKVTGGVAGQVRTDPEDDKTLGELIELGQAKKEANSWLVNFPATPIARVTKINGGASENFPLTTLKAFSEAAILENAALVLLAKRNANGELETELRKWSPLP